jgi:hypothetical protein
MSQAQTIPAGLPEKSHWVVPATADAVSIPWTIWFVLAGINLALVGGTLDMSWHMSIGRETFWTPAHMLIQMESILVGIASGYTILVTTFTSSTRVRAASVRILGLYAPGGAFICLWGSVAMLSSAPFDNWWHNAYGLDTKIVATPPHMLLMIGSFANKIGAMTWMASMMNRSRTALRGRLEWWLLWAGMICVAQLAVMTMDFTWMSDMHTAGCYFAIALLIPPMMIATGWGSAHKWGCTIVGAVYTALSLAAEWLLPLFPAHPKLGPVYHNVTHMVPLRFPLLLIVPAVVTDLLLQRLAQRSSWIKALWVGPAFVLSFLAVQWPFADFLMSPASRNWIFGTAYFGYADSAGFLYDPYKFDAADPLRVFLLTMAATLVVSQLTSRFGLAWGNWLRRVCR